MPRLNAEVDEATRRALYHALLDDGLTFAEWMRRQIDAYLGERRNRPRGAKKAVPTIGIPDTSPAPAPEKKVRLRRGKES
jgi:hypothetical protein